MRTNFFGDDFMRSPYSLGEQIKGIVKKGLIERDSGRHAAAVAARVEIQRLQADIARLTNELETLKKDFNDHIQKHHN